MIEFVLVGMCLFPFPKMYVCDQIRAEEDMTPESGMVASVEVQLVLTHKKGLLRTFRTALLFLF